MENGGARFPKVVRELSVILIAMVTAACGTSQAPIAAASDQEKEGAFFAYFSCLHAAARKMDDGKSDASSVAFAIKSMCVSEFARTVEIQGRGLNPQARRMFEDRVANQQLEIATKAVLDERAKRP